MPRPRAVVPISIKLPPILADRLYRVADSEFRGNVSEAVRLAVQLVIGLFTGECVPAFVVCKDKQCMFVDQSFAEQLGYIPEDFLGKNVEDIISFLVAPNFREAILERRRSRMKGEEVSNFYVLDMLCKDGSTKTYLVYSRFFSVAENHVQVLVFSEATRIAPTVGRSLENMMEDASKRRGEKVVAGLMSTT